MRFDGPKADKIQFFAFFSPFEGHSNQIYVMNAILVHNNFLLNTKKIHQRYNKLSCFWLQGQRYSIQFAQNFQFPIKNRAIVLHADENLKLREYAENALKYLDLLLASSISFLRAGIPGDKFFHILSFRRQVYVYSNTE